MSHLIADTDEELDSFARLLGLKTEWKQRDHYDVSESMRRTALKLGASSVSVQMGARMIHVQRVVNKLRSIQRGEEPAENVKA